MESRAEPRFETRAAASIEVVRDKVYTYDATITEVSGIGLRIELAQELTVGQDIRLRVSDYLVFARVRRCIPSESGFTIGLERVDGWNAPSSGSASAPQTTAAASAVKVLGRPKLKNPLDSLHGASLQALFSDPRLRTRKTKFQAAAIAAGCIAMAAWAGIGAGISLHGRVQAATPPKARTAKQLPGAPKTAADIAPAKSAATNTVATNIAATNLAASQAGTSTIIVPALQKTEVAAPPKLAPRSAIGAASKISIRATDVSWVTACADGAKVLNTLLTKGYAGGISFSRQATIRFGNAGAIELAIGNQPATKLGQTGEIRAIKATPTGYELIAVPSALNCNLP